MNEVVVALVVVVAFLVIWLLAQSLQNRKKEEEARARINQVQRDVQGLAGQTQNFSQQIGQLGQNLAKSLEGVTGALQKGVTDSATIAAQAQSAMAGELKNSRETLGQIQQQLGAVQQAGQQMSQAAQTLHNILGGAKSRGSLGEVALERLLEDALPRDRYQRQYKFTTGETVDAVIFLRDRLLSIDSKFPLDAYRRMNDLNGASASAQATGAAEESRRAFVTAVKGHADTIAKKYLLPDEGTLEIALMFVPSENVYYELLMTSDAKQLPLDEYCRSKNVIAVSPNTLYAHLQVILMGLRGMQIEENAKQLHASLAGLQKQLENLADPFGKLGTHLKNAQQSYADAEKRLEKAESTLENMLGAGSGDASLAGAASAGVGAVAQELKNVQGTLALPADLFSEKNS
jgi:DNA recombination protein RmuC